MAGLKKLPREAHAATTSHVLLYLVAYYYIFPDKKIIRLSVAGLKWDWAECSPLQTLS